MVLGAAAIALGSCGGSENPSSAGLRLQRQDLVVVSHALQHVEGPVAAEVAATKGAWPIVANGLPAHIATASRTPISHAADVAARLEVPAVFEETQAAALTGPAASVAGLFRSYAALATRGWELIGAAIDQIERGPVVAGRFARSNVALYIESVYDGHFSLAQIGKKLTSGYDKLGGGRVFGSALTQSEVDALAGTYSEAGDRLHPHVGVRLGS